MTHCNVGVCIFVAESDNGDNGDVEWPDKPFDLCGDGCDCSGEPPWDPSVEGERAILPCDSTRSEEES